MVFPAAVRIFNFGVGYDVNTFLLDKLAEDNQGSANYVKPGENIEQEVSLFFAKISNPVLKDVEIQFGDAGSYDVYPAKISDIFQGQRISIFGRYRKSGKTTIVLSGMQGDRRREFTYEVNFDRRDSRNDYIAKLWANRKVSHLLNQIRFQGENSELVESIKILGKEYGLVTPYTSYLVTEQEKELAALDNRLRSGEEAPTEIRMKSAQRARESKNEMDEESVGSSSFYEALSAAPAAADKASGRGAVMSSRVMKKISSAEKDFNMLLTIQYVMGKTFYLRNGIWVEEGIEAQKTPDKKIKFLSDNYFKLLKLNSDIQKILAIGERLLFSWKGSIYQVEKDMN
jgi:Ca-activated chloride channel family protein